MTSDMLGASPSPPQQEQIPPFDLAAIDRELARRSLIEFVRQAWHTLEPPSRPFIENWHLGAICLPAETIIETESGPQQIGYIVENKWTGKVLSVNHSTKNIEWRTITKHMLSPSDSLFVISTDGGREIRATGNHPVFVVGKGYVRADALAVGDRLAAIGSASPWLGESQVRKVCLPILQRKKGMGRGSMPGLRLQVQTSWVRDTVSALRRIVLSITGQVRSALLFDKMFWFGEVQSGELFLPAVRCPEGVGRVALSRMLRQVQSSRIRDSVSAVRKLSLQVAITTKVIHAQARSILQSRLPRRVRSWTEQCGLYRWTPASSVFTWLQDGEKARAPKRQENLLSLRDNKAAAGRSPHRPRPEQQSHGQSCGTLSRVSRARAQTTTGGYYSASESAIVSIEREVRRSGPLYNIEVDGNHNYVAGGVLVHNCEHLEAVTSGQIRNLLITVPPGSAKSWLVNLAWPAWEWGPKALPWTRWLCASYSADLATRDARRCRVLMESEWYQRNWGHVFSFASDQNQKARYENDKTGYRIATGITGLGTGERADRICFDDPHNVRQSLSAVQRLDALVWWDETASTRPVDPSKSAFVGIMQRLAEEDLAGHWLAEGGVTHLMIPMEFEPDRRCFTEVRPKDYAGPPAATYCWDPRTEEGELMFPARFPADALAPMKKRLGKFGVAGQFQQRPAPRGGGMFDVHCIELVDAAPASRRRVRFWDLAGTKLQLGNDPAYTAGVLISVDDNDLFYIEDVVRFRDTPTKVEQRIIGVASQDGPRVRIGIPKDPGQAGVMQSGYLARKLAGYVVKIIHETGDKETRAEALASQVGAGNVKMLRGDWNDDFLSEAETFPAGKFKDQVDAAANGFHMLAEPVPKFAAASLVGHSVAR